MGAFRAANCLADLRDLHARINADHPYLSDAGIEITMVGVSETQNRLELWTASSLSAEQRGLLTGRYPQEQLLIVEGMVVRQT